MSKIGDWIIRMEEDAAELSKEEFIMSFNYEFLYKS